MKLTGIPITNGLAIGRVMRYTPDNSGTGADFSDPLAWTEEELNRYHQAETEVKRELNLLVQNTANEGQSHGDIFYTHVAMLEDQVLNAEIEDRIANRHMCASAAVREVFDHYQKVLAQTKAPLIQERAVDLADIKLRLLRFLAGRTHRGLSQLPGPVVVVASNLMPSDTATMDRENVLAIVTQAGSKTSHSAIIARSYDIPTIVGVEGALDRLQNGETVVVDCRSGSVLTQVDEDAMEAYRQERDRLQEQKRHILGMRKAVPITKDGKRIRVEVNMEALTQEVLDAREYADGVGLFRTEFLYMNRWDLPTEEEQFQTYRRVAEAFGAKPVILRTIDLGGDKPAPCIAMAHEENPFLGNRALRLCLTQPDIFRTQLKAALRAAVYGNIRLLLPMVSSVEDILYAKAILEEAKAELRAEKQKFRERIPLGIMVEIPSVAMIADLAAGEADFACLGTNDLCQYMTAADRQNPAVAIYYRTFHPSMLRIISQVTEAFHKQGKPVTCCGEMAGDPVAALALIGLGVDGLSMGVSSLPAIKQVVTAVSFAETKNLLEQLKKRCLAGDIQEALQQLLDSVL